MKILFLVLDGLGDEPNKILNDKTPLEAAIKPNINILASNGFCGLLKPSFYGSLPTSEEGHFALFGYDSKDYELKRGVITAIGCGIELKKGELAIRGNFSFVDENGKIIDRRAGRISDVSELVKAINGMAFDGVEFVVSCAAEYRVVIVMSDRKLSDNITDGDEHYAEEETGNFSLIMALDNTAEAQFTAKALNKFLAESHKILNNHPVNIEREKQGLSKANYILTRGAGFLPENIISFERKHKMRACCIAGSGFYKGIGRVLGMDIIEVEGANDKEDTNISGKIKTACDSLNKYDFVYCHFKATDGLSHAGDPWGKKEFIEKVDKELGIFINNKQNFKDKDVVFVITGDHNTSSITREHIASSIPFLVCRLAGDFKTNSDKINFSEKECKHGKLGEIEGIDLIPKIIKINSTN